MGEVTTSTDIESVMRAAETRFPNIRLSFGDFEPAYQQARLSGDVFADDLFLARACAKGDPHAQATFERDIMPMVPSFISQLRLPPSALDDFLQDLRIRLLYASPPLIEKFSGKGPLTAWVRVSAVRAAIRFIKGARKHSGVFESDLIIGGLCDANDQGQLAQVLASHKDALKEVFESALQKMTDRERAVIRMYVLDGLNIEGIGKVYGVHRATVARWIVAIRSELLETIRSHLGLRIRTSSGEADSLFRQFAGDLRISVSRVLGR